MGRVTEKHVTLALTLALFGCAQPGIGNLPQSATVVPEKESLCLTGNAVDASGAVTHWMGGTAPLDCRGERNGVQIRTIGFVRVDQASDPDGEPIDVSDIKRGMQEILIASKGETTFSATYWHKTSHNIVQSIHTWNVKFIEDGPSSISDGNGTIMPVVNSKTFKVHLELQGGHYGSQDTKKTVARLRNGDIIVLNDGNITISSVSLSPQT